MEALAVRHRPRSLQDVVGQDKITAIVNNMLTSGEFPQTFLLSGPFGCGKTTISRLIAVSLNCSDLTSGNPCWNCASCKAFLAGNHPSIVELNAASSRGIDDIRELIQQSAFAPRFKYRVYILDESHAITKDGQQALLKVLEEPPKSTVFILCTTEPEKLAPQIRSRCSHLKLGTLNSEQISSLVQSVANREECTIPNEAIDQIIEVANGHPRDALAALEKMIHLIKSGLTGEELTNRAISEIVQTSPEIAIRSVVSNLLQCKGTAALQACSNIPNPEIAVQRIINMLHHAIAFKLKLPVDPAYAAVFQKINLADVRTLTAICRKFTDGLVLMKQFTVDNNDLLLLLVLEATINCKDSSA